MNTEYKQAQNKSRKELAQRLKELTGLPFTTKTNDDGYKEIILKTTTPDGHAITIFVRPWDRDVTIWSYDIRKLKYVNPHTIINNPKDFKIQKPHTIHTLSKRTTATIKAWIDYVSKVYDAIARISQERIAKIDAFLEKAKAIGITNIKKSDYDNNIYGSITKNGIEYTFIINSINGSIDEKLSIAHTDNPITKLEQFKKLTGQNCD